MNSQKYLIVKRYLGVELLKYSLNYEKELTWETEFSELLLSKEQQEALGFLSDIIKKLRIEYVKSEGYGDGFYFLVAGYTIDNKNIFNYCRSLCKGEFPNFSNSDKLLTFILSIAVEKYPIFLIKSIYNDQEFFEFSSISMNKHNQIISLVKHDDLDKLTNKKDGLVDYKFEFLTTYDLKFKMQVSSALLTIISRAFANCCLKMAYSLRNFLDEITRLIEKFRTLANGKEEEFSFFIGCQGVSIKTSSPMELSNCVLRPINDNRINPGSNLNLISTGAILECRYSIKIIQSNNDINSISNFSKELQEDAVHYLDNIKYSICFALNENCAFVEKFIENGFPLVCPGNYLFADKKILKKIINIKESHLSQLKYWYEILSSIGSDIKHIKIPLQRLNYAIYERTNPQDAILDAVTAWESMFSGTPETKFKVTATIAKFLKPLNLNSAVEFVARGINVLNIKIFSAEF